MHQILKLIDIWSVNFIEIWKFFSKYDINGLIGGPTLIEGSVFDSEISIYPNPANTKVSIQSSSSKDMRCSTSSLLPLDD